MAAVLYNGLGRYAEALAAAGQATEHVHPACLPWALPELIEAAARSGNARARGRGARHGLRRRHRPAAPTSALGIQARSAALLSQGETAEGCYREAIDRLGRTRLRPELARAHLLYGEWLRRENRGADAREQLRTAHDMLAAMGMEAFAERARRELAATGETVRKRTRRDGAPTLTAQEAQIARLAARRPHQPGDRRPAVHQRPHGRMAPAQGLRQARHFLAPRAARGAARPKRPDPHA